MAFWTCGFEAGDLTYYTEKGWIFTTCSIVSTAGRVHNSLSGRGGTYSLQVDQSARTPAFGTGGRWLHFWLEDFQATNQNLTINFIRSAAIQATVVFYFQGTVQLRRAAAANLAIGEFNPYVPHWIAIELDALNAGGTLSVYVDGVLSVTYSGDTQGTANGEQWDQVLFDPSGSNWDSCIDDIIITTATEGRLDETFLSPMQPSANDGVLGSGAGSTNGAGSFNNIEDLPPNADYNEFTSATQDRYETGNLGFTPVNIHSVTVMARAAREGSLDTLQTICATGTGPTEALGDAFGGASAGAYSPWQDTFTQDPDTSSAIATVSTGSDFFGIAGDVTSDIRVGSTIVVTGSTGNDGTYSVASTTFNSPNTEITVNEDVTDATADGTLTYNWTITGLDDLRIGVKVS